MMLARPITTPRRMSKNRFHAFPPPQISIDRGFCRIKIRSYIKTVRCSFGGRVLRNIFFAIVSASAVFVNRFFENLTFAWRVCRSAQNIDVSRSVSMLLLALRIASRFSGHVPHFKDYFNVVI